MEPEKVCSNHMTGLDSIGLADCTDCMVAGSTNNTKG